MTVVFRAELGRGGRANDFDIAQRVMMRLHQEFRKLIGPAGFDVLVARSLVFARQAHPILVGVNAGPGGTIAGLDGERERVALQEGAMAIVSHFMELLVKLIGEDLAMRLVRDIWPGATEKEKK